MTTVDASTLLQPGQIIKPQMTDAVAAAIFNRLYGMKVKTIKELNSFDDKNYHITIEPDIHNPNITDIWPHGYILKVLNSMDSLKTHVDAEHQAMDLLRKAGVVCPVPVLNIHGKDKSLEKIYLDEEHNIQCDPKQVHSDSSCSQHMVRLLTFLPGKIFADIPYTPDILYQVGQSVADLEKALSGFSHPALTGHQTVWSLISTPQLRDFLYAVKEETDRKVIEEVLQAFSEEILPNVGKFKEGVIHGDYNEQNLIVNEVAGREKYEITGVIDFGDLQDSHYVFEIAIVIMYMMVESKVIDPMLVGGHVLAGYLTQMELSDDEFDALKLCVAARYAQSLVLGAYSYSLDPGNEYVIVTAKRGWPQLHKLWSTPKNVLYNSWREVMKNYQ